MVEALKNLLEKRPFNQAWARDYLLNSDKKENPTANIKPSLNFFINEICTCPFVYYRHDLYR